MTTWSQGGSNPSSNWSGTEPDPDSTWDECGPAPASAWRPCGLTITPDSGDQSATVPVTIRGDGFSVATTVQVSGAGVAVQNLVVVDGTTLTADFVIDEAASADARTVTVTTGPIIATAAFAVEEAGAPDAPLDLQATGASLSTIAVTWDAVADAVTYDLQRNGVTIVSDIPAGTTNYLDSGLSPGTAYAYAVRACNAAGCSDWSGEVVGSTYDWTSIANRVLWLEGDVDADFTIATGVSAWRDHSSNGRSLVQATAAKQPTLVAGAMKGRQAVRFDGADDLMTALVDFQLSAGSTLVLVANVRFVNDTTYRPLLRTEPSNAFGVQHEASNDPTSPSKLEAFVTAASGLKRATPAAVTVAGIRCISVVVDPSAGTITIWKDGVVVGGPVSSVTGLTSSLADTLRLCADATGVNFGTYDIGTVRLFQRALSIAERQATEADAMSRWVP